MKKILFALIFFGLSFLTACGTVEEKVGVLESGNEVSPTKMESRAKIKEAEKEKSKVELIVEKEENNQTKRSEEERKKLTETWVTEAEFSKGQTYHYPLLNEEVFGEEAREFNKEILALHEASEHFFKEADGEFFKKKVFYKTFLDSSSNLFSLMARCITINGDVTYKTFVVDIDTKKEIDFGDVLERINSSLSELNAEVKDFYETLYSGALSEGLVEDEIDVEMEDYVKERLYYFGKSLQRPVPEGVRPTLFTVKDGFLTLYMMVREAGSGFFYYRPYYMRKNLVERAVLNREKGSVLAVLHPVPGSEETKDIKTVKEIATETKGEKKFFVSLKDGTKLRLIRIEYDDKRKEFVDMDILYEGELKRGEAIGLDTVISEELPKLRLEAEVNGLSYVSELEYHGRFKPPVIEYLKGE